MKASKCRISYELLKTLLEKCLNLPDDVKIVRTNDSKEFGDFEIIMLSAKFENVPEGHEIPIVKFNWIDEGKFNWIDE